MATIDLSGFTLSELKTLRDDIDKQMKERKHQDVKRAREQILAIVQDLGMDLKDVLSIPGKQKAEKKQGEKRDPLYRNPDDASQTWTGRGRKPAWLADGLAGGKQLEDFRI